MSHITYYPDEGVTPHYSPQTEDCVLVNINGQPTWKVTSYSMEEKNDGSEKYQIFFSRLANNVIQIIDSLQTNANTWPKLDGSTQHNLTAYKLELQKANNFPAGTGLPMKPPIDLSPVNRDLPPSQRIRI